MVALVFVALDVEPAGTVDTWVVRGADIVAVLHGQDLASCCSAAAVGLCLGQIGYEVWIAEYA